MKTSEEDTIRAKIIKLRTEEKDKYSLYLQLCKHYGIEPDQLVTSAWQAKNEILAYLLDGKMI